MNRLILVSLICVISISSLTETSQSSVDQLVNEQVKSKFLDDETPVRYYSNILIRLDGNVTKVDSLIFRELVDTLNILIDKWDVYIIPKGTSNLEFEINAPYRKGELDKIIEQDDHPGEIVKRTVVLNLPEDLDYNSRRKTIYYYLLRSIVKIKPRTRNQNFVKGSVFSEYDTQKITFHPVDFAIIKELYSQKYEDRHKTGSTIKISRKFISSILYSLIAMLGSFIFLIFMSIKGRFNEHNYKFKPFLKQGLIVLMASAFYFVVSKSISVSPLKAAFVQLIGMMIGFFIVGFISICLIFIFERTILKGNSNFSFQILVPFFSIALLVLVLLSAFIISNLIQQIGGIYYPIFYSMIYYLLIIGFARSIYIYTRKKSESIIREKDLELAKMNELHKQAELQSLRAKINPHFLYNALNSIASLASSDSNKTEQMALALSDFFKYAINREQKQLNTLSEELNATQTYLEIEKVRFGDRLRFEIDCPAELLDIQVPQVLIQPLVENAIKHGLSQITDDGLIRIVVEKTESFLNIRVYDNGPAFPDGPLTGFGIRNTQERIMLLYGEKAALNWINVPEKYIGISIPFTKSNQPNTK